MRIYFIVPVKGAQWDLSLISISLGKNLGRLNGVQRAIVYRKGKRGSGEEHLTSRAWILREKH